MQPEHPTPGLGKLAAICLALTLLAFAAALVWDYFRTAPNNGNASGAPRSAANGSGTGGTEDLEEAARAMARKP